VRAVHVDRANGDEELLADLVIRVADRGKMDNVASRSASGARRGSHQLLAQLRHRLAGDHNAANIVLKCMARRCTVLGFDRPDNLNATTAPRVVIGGTTE
jgi:hypothetical protein